jgi:hypothetical protein
MTKSIQEYNTESLDAINRALYPEEHDAWDQEDMEGSIRRTAAALVSTADYDPAVEMCQFIMAQGLVDMAFNKGTSVVERLDQAIHQLQQIERRNDGTEIFEQELEKQIWRVDQLKKQRWYWQRCWKALHANYIKVITVMKNEGTYDWIPDNWEPPAKRYAHLNEDKKRQLERRKITATSAAAAAQVRKHHAA